MISIGLYNLKLKTTTTTIATRLAQLDKRRFAEREATGSYPGRTNPQGFKKKLRRKCCLCEDFCKRLDFIVFSDKDDNLRLKTLAHTAISRKVSDKVHPTTSKGIVGGFKFTVFQRNLKEWQERQWTYVCKC